MKDARKRKDVSWIDVLETVGPLPSWVWLALAWLPGQPV